MTIKVAYIVSTLENKGPIRQLYGIVKELDREKFEILIITLSEERHHTLYDHFKDLGVDIISLKYGRFKGVFFTLPNLNRILTKFGVNVIHTQGIRPDIFVNFVRIKLPYTVITTVRNFAFADYSQKFGNVLGNLLAIVHLRSLRNRTNVACSHSLATRLRNKGFHADQVILNGTDSDKYAPADKKEKMALRKQFGIDDKKVVFVYCGSLIKLKNLVTLIHGFVGIRADSEYELIIVGDGSEKDFLMRLSKTNKVNARFVGRVDDPHPYYSISDCYISMSTSEGLPNSVLEAQACGLSTILSNIPAHRELVSSTANLVNCYDSNALRQKVENYIAEAGSDSIGSGNKSEVTTFANMSKKYADLYVSLKEKM